jgi:hypothetical protein
MRKSILLVLLLCVVVPGWTALAPHSPEELKARASHIVTGAVVSISSKTQKSKVERGFGIKRDRIFTIGLKVASVTKGADVKAGQVIQVEAWQPSTRIPPLPGPQGHEGIPKVGDTVIMYLLQDASAGFVPVLPNGIQK